MPFWTSNLIHTITYARPSASAVDANGDPSSIASQVTVAARVEARRELVRGPDGKEVMSTHKIFCDVEIKMGDRVWAPGLGDDIAKPGDARHPLTIQVSERLHGGGQKLVTVWL